MDSLKLGVIGCGNMGISLAQGASVLNCTNVVCVSDVDEKKGQDLAGQMSCDFEPDYRAMLSRQDVDAVLIATPPFLHEEPAIAAAEAGVHIFCEKPMAPTLKGCDAIQDAVTKHKVKLGLGLVCRFHPVHRKVRELAHSGDLGTPTCMTVHRLGGGWGGQWTAAWRQTRAQSGGTLMEVNAHEIDFLRAVMGEVVQVYATGGSYARTDADFPDIVLVNLTFKSGATGLLHSSMASTIGGYGGRLDCTEGTVAFPT
ncbi:MAG: Gfo/Idh/MocA family oxidoreductase, partial [bacterium]|nr:Gfo/Idh/MocA family oxidoreductase [bacterium]